MVISLCYCLQLTAHESTLISKGLKRKTPKKEILDYICLTYVQCEYQFPQAHIHMTTEKDLKEVTPNMPWLVWLRRLSNESKGC